MHVDRTSDILLPISPPTNSTKYEHFPPLFCSSLLPPVLLCSFFVFTYLNISTIFEKTNTKNTTISKAPSTLDVLASGDEKGFICLQYVFRFLFLFLSSSSSLVFFGFFWSSYPFCLLPLLLTVSDI